MLPPSTRYPPGTRLTVGSHQVAIIKYISAGGFAHVFTCTIDPPFHGERTACLKRVIVPNKTQLTLLRQEVDAMKRLRGNKHIVSYIDSHALRMPPDSNGIQYEVLLLMEYCLGKGLIDYMNTRLTHRLEEPEILSIMRQVTTGVAMCHHLHPPLMHRDIKIENVLIDASGTYKLCDFGSAIPYCPVPKSAAELQVLHEDIMHHTTPQYRAPEMIDLSRGLPVDDKLDVWALGIFLYKMCYYTTPFELPAQRTLADLERLILAGAIQFPLAPRFLPRLINVIRCCLREDPRRRPNALQLLGEVCAMEGMAVPDVVPYLVRLRRETLDGSAGANGPKVAKTETGEMKTETRTSRTDTAASKSSVPLATTKSNVSLATTQSNLSLASTKSVLAVPGYTKTGAAMPHLSVEKTRRPMSAIYPAKSTASLDSLQDLIKNRVYDSVADVSNIRKSEELDRGTLDFLRSNEPQTTGGSLKASIKNSLRRISTGGSVRHTSASSSDETLRVPEKPRRSSSIQRRMAVLFRSEKIPKTAQGYGRYTDEDIVAINHTDLSVNGSADSLLSDDAPARFEFEKRLASPPNIKSTHKYEAPPPCPPSLSYSPAPGSKSRGSLGSKGGSSGTKVGSSGTKIPSTGMGTSKLAMSKLETSKVGAQASTKGGAPSKSATRGGISTTALSLPPPTPKRPPPKPKKPQHLQVHEDQRRLSDVSLPDVDDLEKQFSRRFPSYV